jgi:spermidine synthase
MTPEGRCHVRTTSLTTFHLQVSKRKYDVIVTDVFHDISVPYHLVTREFAQTVRRKLTDSGIYMVNIVDIFPDARLVKSLVKHCRASSVMLMYGWTAHLVKSSV